MLRSRFLPPVVGIALILTSWGEGCVANASCVAETTQSAIKHHPMVFLGTVESVRDAIPPVRQGARSTAAQCAAVRMSAIWKGIPRREITLWRAYAHGGLVAGESYVFYADSLAGTWWIDPCSRTAPRAQAAEDLAQLGKPTIVQRLPGRKPRPTP